MKLEKNIKGPVITEKGIQMESADKYVMAVALHATKDAIALELKKLFGVDVLDVNTMVMPGKKRRVLKTYRFKKTKKWKKAVVRVKSGQKIDIFPKESK